MRPSQPEARAMGRVGSNLRRSRVRVLATLGLRAILSLALVAGGIPVARAQQAAAARVENLRAEPRGGGAVAILYDLVAPDAARPFTVSLEASDDGGTTFALVPRTVSGDVGDNVSAGTGKTILWQVGQDVEVFQVERLRFNIRLTQAPRPEATGQLAITSVPAGAQVLIGGEARGVTPLTVSVPVGRHDVRLVRDGYLENRRSVEVRAGRTETLGVTLTRAEASTPSTQTAAPSSGGGGSPLLWVALAAGGAAAAVLATRGGDDDDDGGSGTGTVPPPPPPTCSFSASPSTGTFPAIGGTLAITVSPSPAGCSGGSWTASAGTTAWVTVAPASGTAAATVTLTAAANSTAAARSGSVTVAGTTITLTQPSSCSYSAIFVAGDGDPRDSPRTVVPGDCSGPNCGRRRIQVTTADACAWSVSGLPSWLTIEDGLGPFTGPRQIIMYVTQTNPGGSFRQVTFTIGTQTMTVEQCPGRCP